MIKDLIFLKENIFKVLMVVTLALFVTSVFYVNYVDAQVKTPGLQLATQGSSYCSKLGGSGANVKVFAYCITQLAVGSFVPYIFALALLSFMVAIFWYIRNADNEQKRAEAIKWIIWSIVGLFFMVTFWTFAKFFGDFFGAPAGIIPQFQ